MTLPKKPPRPFALRQWISSEPLRKQLQDIREEANAGSIKKFNLECRLSALETVIGERDDLQNYARAMERYARTLRAAVGKTEGQK